MLSGLSTATVASTWVSAPESGPSVLGTPGIHGMDPIKVVIDVNGLGITGFAAADWLRQTHGVFPEFADLRRIVCSITPADTDASAAALVESVRALVDAPIHHDRTAAITSRWPHASPPQSCTPRQALQQRTEDLALDRAVGRTAAEMVVPYPPGIPLLVPGETVTAEVAGTIRQLVGAGCRIVGVVDPKGTMLRCLDRDEL